MEEKPLFKIPEHTAEETEEFATENYHKVVKELSNQYWTRAVEIVTEMENERLDRLEETSIRINTQLNKLKKN